MLLLLVVGVVLLVSGAFGEGPREKRGDSPPGGTTTPSPWTPAGQAVGVQPSPLDCTKDGVSATAVRQAQQAWAQYLGRQVEEEDEIAPGVKMKFVLIPPGTFQMGSPTGESERSTNEAPHEVELRYPFYLGANDVTVGEFRRFVDATKYKTEAESDGKGGYGGDPDKGTFTQDPKYTWRTPGFSQSEDDPVVEVSWNDAGKYIEWVNGNARDGLLYRLPREAEWEYSCRGGRSSSLAFGVGDGTTLSTRNANFSDSNLNKTTPVDTYKPNTLGLYDMQGNVYQWCSDWYGDYPAGHAVDPTGPLSGSSRVFRGGGWDDGARLCRAAHRYGNEPGLRLNDLGFRLALVPSGLDKW